MSAVHENGREVAPISQSPALGMSLQVDLGAGRICTLQTFVPSDCTLPALNGMLDKLTSAGDRQRAHYKLEELERDLAKLDQEQWQHQEDLERIDKDFETAQQKRFEAVESAHKALANYDRAMQVDAEERGRRQPRPTSQEQANKRKTQDGIDRLKGEISAAEEEHAKARDASLKVIERRAALIQKTRDEINRCKEIVAAGLKA